MVVVEGAGQKVGLVVDDLLAQQQVVIKSLETNYKRVDGLSGATILGDGTVAMILDVGGLISFSKSLSPELIRARRKAIQAMPDDADALHGEMMKNQMNQEMADERDTIH